MKSIVTNKEKYTDMRPKSLFGPEQNNSGTTTAIIIITVLMVLICGTLGALALLKEDTGAKADTKQTEPSETVILFPETTPEPEETEPVETLIFDISG